MWRSGLRVDSVPPAGWHTHFKIVHYLMLQVQFQQHANYSVRFGSSHSTKTKKGTATNVQQTMSCRKELTSFGKVPTCNTRHQANSSFPTAWGSVDINSENIQSDNNLTKINNPLSPFFFFPTFTWIVIFNIVHETKYNKIKIRSLFLFFLDNIVLATVKMLWESGGPCFFALTDIWPEISKSLN